MCDRPSVCQKEMTLSDKVAHEAVPGSTVGPGKSATGTRANAATSRVSSGATGGEVAHRALPQSALTSVIESVNRAWQPEFMSLLQRVLDLDQQLQWHAASVVTPAAVAQVRVLDALAPSAFRLAELNVTARVAEMVSATSAASAWRQSLLSEQIVASLAQLPLLRTEPMMVSLLRDLNRISQTASSLTETAARFSAPSVLAPQVGRQPATELRRYLQTIPAEVNRHHLLMGSRGGAGVAGLTGTALVVSVDDSDRLDEAVKEVEGELVVPWLSGPGDARAELFGRLGQIDALVPDLLHGAWDDVVRAGPAASVKVATCAVEALERTLRALAPDEPVLAWFAGQAGLKSGLDGNGHPTYALRVRYVLRERKSDRKLILSQIDAVVGQVPELRSRLQAGKHASSGSLSALRAHLVSVEAVLMQLTLVGG